MYGTGYIHKARYKRDYVRKLYIKFVWNRLARHFQVAKQPKRKTREQTKFFYLCFNPQSTHTQTQTPHNTHSTLFQKNEEKDGNEYPSPCDVRCDHDDYMTEKHGPSLLQSHTQPIIIPPHKLKETSRLLDDFVMHVEDNMVSSTSSSFLTLTSFLFTQRHKAEREEIHLPQSSNRFFSLFLSIIVIY